MAWKRIEDAGKTEEEIPCLLRPTSQGAPAAAAYRPRAGSPPPAQPAQDGESCATKRPRAERVLSKEMIFFVESLGQENGRKNMMKKNGLINSAKFEKIRISGPQHEKTCSGLLGCNAGIDKFNLDSASSYHITGNVSWLGKLRPVPPTVEPLDDATSRTISLDGMGDIATPELVMANVIYSGLMSRTEHYASIGQMTGSGYIIKITRGRFYINSRSRYNHIVGYGSLDKSAMTYFIDFFNEAAALGQDFEIRENEPGDDDYQPCEGPWILDSGCPFHMTGQPDRLTNMIRVSRSKKATAAGSEGGSISSNRKGTVNQEGLTVKNVFLCSGITANLLSVPQLDTKGYSFMYRGSYCYIFWNTNMSIVGRAAAEVNIYYMEYFTAQN